MPKVQNMVEYRQMVQGIAKAHGLAEGEVEAMLALEMGINENMVGPHMRPAARSFVFKNANRKDWVFDVPAIVVKWQGKVKKPK